MTKFTEVARKPNTQLVSVLKRLVTLAEEGKIIGMAGIADTPASSVISLCVVQDPRVNVFALIGGLTVLNAALAENTSERINEI